MRHTKTTIAAACVLLAALLLAGCGQPALPEGVTEEELTAHAQSVIALVNERDYAALTEVFSAEAGITEDDWPGMLEPYTDEFGDFTGYGEAKFVTGKSDDYDALITVYQETKYTDTDMVWQITFTPDYELVGLRL